MTNQSEPTRQPQVASTGVVSRARSRITLRDKIIIWLIPKMLPKWTAFWEKEVDQLREARERHRKGGGCEFPDTCGGCHWYSGAIYAMQDVIYGKGWRD